MSFPVFEITKVVGFVDTLQTKTEIQGPVFIAVFDDELMPTYQKLARELRQEGIDTEIFKELLSIRTITSGKSLY